MNKLILVFLASMLGNVLYAQSILGDWNGYLNVGGVQLQLIFHITQEDEKLMTTMDSPNQGAMGIAATSTTFDNNVLKISIVSAGILYTGSLDPNNPSLIKGTLNQSGMSFDIDLSRVMGGAVWHMAAKPQNPIEPYPYYSKEVVFSNIIDGISLSGTLTKPQKRGKFPAVILISGSGPQNRDEEILGHKPFLVLADYLTRNGIAVLRYDDRGTAKSTGNFADATTVDFARDAKAAAEFLRKQKGITKVGLIGHSEGGLIAAMVAAEMPEIVFVVLLAAPGIRGDSLLLLQQNLIGKVNGFSKNDLEKTTAINQDIFNLMLRSNDFKEINKNLKNYFLLKMYDLPASMKPTGMGENQIVDMLVAQYGNKWMINFVKTDPTQYLAKTLCPVLALNGERDLQVPAKENIGAIGSTLAKAGNTQVKTVVIPKLNHLFQECKTGSPSEYASIEQTFSPKALEIIGQWILGLE